jgi:hypothetical protein
MSLQSLPNLAAESSQQITYGLPASSVSGCGAINSKSIVRREAETICTGENDSNFRIARLFTHNPARDELLAELTVETGTLRPPQSSHVGVRRQIPNLQLRPHSEDPLFKHLLHDPQRKHLLPR